MLAASMAIFEFGLSLTAQQGQMIAPPNFYTGGTSEQYSDQLWLKLLNDTDALNAMGRDLASQSLCDQLMCRVNELDRSLCIGDNMYQEGFDELAEFQATVTKDSSSYFMAACALVKGEHRVLIVPNSAEPAAPYGLYSCLTKEGPFCSFEL
jgi:hypothetical protein